MRYGRIVVGHPEHPLVGLPLDYRKATNIHFWTALLSHIPTCKPLTPATHMAARLANAASLASAILLPSRTISASLRHEVLLLTVVSNGAK